MGCARAQVLELYHRLKETSADASSPSQARPLPPPLEMDGASNKQSHLWVPSASVGAGVHLPEEGHDANQSGKNKKDEVPTCEKDAWRALVTNTNKCMIEYDVQEAIAKMRRLDTRFEEYLRILQDQQANDTGNTYQSYKKALTNRVRSYRFKVHQTHRKTCKCALDKDCYCFCKCK
jgi:hypothetical protein